MQYKYVEEYNAVTTAIKEPFEKFNWISVT